MATIFRRIFQILKSNLEKYPEEISSRENQDNYSLANQNHKICQHYANLELPFGAPLEEVERQWKKLMKKYHPDLFANAPEKLPDAQKLSQSLTEAFQAIKDYHLKGGK